MLAAIPEGKEMLETKGGGHNCGLVVAFYSEKGHRSGANNSAAAAAAAKSRQSCPTLCDPIGSSPPGSPVPEILQARTLEWVAISWDG